MAPTDLAGRWKMYKSENFEDFLVVMGANWLIRKAAAQFNPTVEILIDGDNIQLKTTTMMWTQEDNLTIGQPTEKKMPQGAVTMRMTPEWDGDKLVINMVPIDGDRGKPHKITREVVGQEMVTKIEVDNVVCKRYFKRADTM